MKPKRDRKKLVLSNTLKRTQEIHNNHLADIIKKKLEQNQQINSFNNDEEDFNPWKPYVGHRQLSSIELFSDDEPKRINTQDSIEAKEKDKDTKTYSKSFTSQLKDMIFHAI